jgi:hypothetical protein
MILKFSRFPGLLAVGLLAASTVPSLGWAEGFGSPTVNGSLVGDESVYGAAEAADPMDPPQGNAPMDLGSLYVANDANFWYFLFTVNEDVITTNWGKYVLFIDTTNDANGGTTDPWGRNISLSDPHKSEFQVRSWVDGGGAYNATKTQLWAWNQGTTSWSSPGSIAEAAVAVNTGVSTFEWKVSRAALGDPSTIWCEVATTSGGGTDNAQDTINDPVDDWNATDWVTTAVLSNSTQVAVSAGVDTTPPTVSGGCVQDPNDGFSDTVVITFSEPVDETTAENAANYSDLGGRSVFTPNLTSPTTVEIVLSPVYEFGGCNQITVTGVEDVAGNTIVNDGSTNTANFFAFRIQMNANMSLHMQADDDPPHTFAIEGSTSPLTWDPTCDFLLDDANADSIYTGNIDFCLPCIEMARAQGGPMLVPVPQDIEYKFTHQCLEYESMGSNHFYTIDPVALGGGIENLNIYWDDEAPGDFTDKDIDVVLTVRSFNGNPPFGAGDTVGVNGSVLPVTWDLPPVNLLADDGVAPDASASDGIFSTRLTFPMGTLKDVEYKYSAQLAAEMDFSLECFGGNNRNIFLDDTIFSTANPIVIDLAYFDDCDFATGAPNVASAIGFSLEGGRPNPTRNTTSISYSLPTPSAVKLQVFDVGGRLVRTLVDEMRPEGRHTVVWNGRLADGSPLPSGVYFTRLEAGDFHQTRKVTVTR